MLPDRIVAVLQFATQPLGKGPPRTREAWVSSEPSSCIFSAADTFTAMRPSEHGHVRFGSWLCENAKTLNRDRRSYSSKTVLDAQRASGFNFEIELKNIILRRVSIFEFLHSQGHSRRFGRTTATSGLHPMNGHSQDRPACLKGVRLMHRNKQLKLFDHVVGAGEQKMRACDLAELARVKRVNFPKAFCA
jgi:hypothetical protein